MKSEKSSLLGFYTIGIAALFLAGFFLLMVFGAHSYRHTVENRNANMGSRALTSYLATTVKAYDTADSVTVESSAYGQTLVVADGNTGYALRIYRRGGELLEDYAELDAALSPDNAQVIGETGLFEIEEKTEGLLLIRTDAGQQLLDLRSEVSGAS